MKKQIIFLAVCAIVLSMGSCTNDVLEDIQQVNGSLPQTRTTTNNEWTYAYVLSEGQLGTTIQGTIGRYNNNWEKEDWERLVAGMIFNVEVKNESLQ